MKELEKADNIETLLNSCPQNQIIGENLIKAWSKINNPYYKKIVCSISGGSDSDIMLDICWKCDKDNKINYIWFDTGLEYQATKDHLKYLEEKYNIIIKPLKAIKPIPTVCKQYGQPFLSKQVSEFIQRLQKHNFKWEDKSFDELVERYPNCIAALKWWCNSNGKQKDISNSRFNISYRKWLKEFIIENPPNFNISNKCCQFAKKDTAHKLLKENNYDLSIIGVRKAEGGARSTAYKSCFDKSGSCDNYRPLFWYKNSDKNDYIETYEIKHSKCYSEYGLKRTGCAGCPYNRNFEDELKIIEKYEPKLFIAVNNIFYDSYNYTRKYKEFCKKMNERQK